MSNALEMFRQQREAVEGLHADITRVADVIMKARTDLDALARHETLRTLLVEEQRWLQRTEEAVREARAWREQEVRGHWPALAMRWLAAGMFAVAVSASAGAGYAWVTQPYARENADLHLRLDFVEALERRMLQMTPAERRQFDGLLKGALPK